MERDEIVRGIAEIPVSRLGKIATDEEIWECQDQRAHFKVTRHVLPIEGSVEFVALTVSGHPIHRKRIINEFSGVLGTPAEESVYDGWGHIDTAAWLVTEVETPPEV